MLIGFFSGHWSATLKNFKSFVEANNDIITEYNKTRGTAILPDGTKLQCISKYIDNTIKSEYDYLILSSTKEYDIDNVMKTAGIKLTDTVPEEYRIIYDIIDEK